MKVTQSNLFLSLIVSGVYLSGCSSSSNPAPAPDDGVNPPNVEVGSGPDTPVAGGGDTVTVPPTTEVPGSVVPETPVSSGNGSVNTPLSGAISQFGTLDISYQQISDETDINASFFQIDVLASGEQLQAALESESIVTDSCELSETTLGGVPDIDDFDIGSFVPDLSSLPATISAGEVITITSPAGTFASLFPTDAFGFLIYNTLDEVEVSGSIPVGTTADIPGALNGFPAFANVTIPPAGPLDFSVAGTAENGFTMTWNSSGTSGSGVVVNLLAFDQGGSDFSSVRNIECSLNDDGTHPLPADLLPSGNDVIISGGTASRRSMSTVQQGAAVLMVISNSNSSITPTF